MRRSRLFRFRGDFVQLGPRRHRLPMPRSRPRSPRELERLAGEGLAPETAGLYRATYVDARARVKRLTGARKVELGGVVKDLEGMAARKQFTLSRVPALFLTLQRNIEWWSAQRLLRSGERVGFTGIRARLPVLSRPRHPDPVARHLRQAQRLLERRHPVRRTGSALLDEIKGLATQRAGGLAWEYLFPFDGQSPPWVSSLAQGTGLQAMARSATRLNRQADVFPVALAGLGIFRTPPPAGVRIASGNGAHYLQYSGLPRFKVLNGFIQSLVGLYDFANLTGDPTAQSLFADGDLAGRAEVPHLRHRRLEPLQPRLAHPRVRPRLPQAAARLPRRSCARGPRVGRVLRRRAALQRVPRAPAGARGSREHAARAQDREHPLQAVEDLARSRSRSRATAPRSPRCTRACSGAGPNRWPGPRRRSPATTTSRSPRPTSPGTPPATTGVITVKKRG